MILNVKQMFEGGPDNSVAYAFSPPPDLIEGCQSISAEVMLYTKADIVRLSLDIRLTCSVCCDRCSVPFENALNIQLEHVLVLELNGEDDGSFIVVENERLDLDELIVSDVLLNIPMKKLCREDCKGICVKCGANLNKVECKCNERDTDPRLSALLKLID